MDIEKILNQTVRIKTEQGSLARGNLHPEDQELIKKQLTQIDPFRAGVQIERDRISALLRKEWAGVGRNASRTAAYRIAKELSIDAEAWTPLMESMQEKK